VLAARSAHELRAHDRRDAFLAQAAVLAPGDDAVRIVTEAALLLDQRRSQEALDVLKALPKKHTAALRLELRAHQLAKNWEPVLTLAPQLEKRGVLDADEALQIRRHAQAQLIEREVYNADGLREAWKRIPSKERKETRLAMAAAKGFSAAGACGEAKAVIEQSLEERWESDLVALYAECEGSEALKRIERAERWLESHPDDAALLLTLGRLCAQQGLWGKAQSYLEASISVEPTHGAHLAAARLQESLGNADGARDHYRKSLELALARLEHLSANQEKII
jgi:HemY protein